MGEAFRIAKLDMEKDYQHALARINRLLDGVKDMEAVTIYGDLDQRVPHNLNINFAFVEGESLLMS
ncbi:cysteine desulfurase, partial [Vibrio vulnificus]